MNATSTALDLTPLAPLEAALERLRGSGWQLSGEMGSVVVTKTVTRDAAEALEELMALQTAAINIDALGERSGTRLLVAVVGGQPVVVESPSADPRELFENTGDQERLRKAADGDASAALVLPMKWTVTGAYDLARVLRVPDRVAVSVAPHAAAVNAYVSGTTALSVDRLVLQDAEHQVLVALGVGGTADFGSVLLTGSAVGEVRLRRPPVLAGERGGSGPAAGRLLPPAGAPATAPQWQAAATHVRALAAQLVWRAIATSEEAGPDGLVLTFHGYKKTSFVLPAASGWNPQQVTDTLALREWALHDASPDRLLAVRQVVSLYDRQDGPFRHNDDIRTSAEVVYVGLRTDAVAEAVKSNREAHAQAQDAARQVVKNAHDMVKAATERMFAALIAVGAVLVANASKALPDDVGRLLLVFVAIFLIVLAVASVALEGPLMALPARKLREDLSHQQGLLTAQQRADIDDTPSLNAARERICVVRWAVPVAHGVFAGLILVFGFPSRY